MTFPVFPWTLKNLSEKGIMWNSSDYWRYSLWHHTFADAVKLQWGLLRLKPIQTFNGRSGKRCLNASRAAGDFSRFSMSVRTPTRQSDSVLGLWGKRLIGPGRTAVVFQWKSSRYLSVSVQGGEVEEERLPQRDAVDRVVQIVTFVKLHLDEEKV